MDKSHLEAWKAGSPPQPSRRSRRGSVRLGSEGDEGEALEEMRQHFGDIPPEERAVICDACWDKIHPRRN